MYKPIPYPTPDKDPRLANVLDKWRTLNRQISDADWHGKPVTKAQRDKLATLKQDVKEGKLWTPNF